MQLKLVGVRQKTRGNIYTACSLVEMLAVEFLCEENFTWTYNEIG